MTVVSHEEGQSHCWINQQAKISLGYFEAGQQLTYRFNPLNKAVFIFNIDGSLEVAGQSLQKRDAIGIWESSEVAIAWKTESRFVIIETPINH